MNDFTDDYNDRPLEPHPGDLSAILPGGVKLYGPVDFLLNAACTDYVRDGKGAFEAVKALPEITVLDLFKFSGLTTAAWAEGLGIAEVTWYKYRNRTDVPAELREIGAHGLDAAQLRHHLVEIQKHEIQIVVPV